MQLLFSFESLVLVLSSSSVSISSVSISSVRSSSLVAFSSGSVAFSLRFFAIFSVSCVSVFLNCFCVSFFSSCVFLSCLAVARSNAHTYCEQYGERKN